MKNAFKFGFLGLALTLMVSACNNTPKAEEVEEVEVVTDGEAVAIEADSTDTVTVEEIEVVADSAATN